MDFLNLNTDPTLGGDNPSDTEVSSQKAVKYYVDMNRIPDGAIFEGKFSELPAFFESLEGKYCNGTVTYKITEDETETVGEYINQALSAKSALNIFVPKFNIENIVIDCNEKTFTNNIPANLWTVSVVFMPLEYKDHLTDGTVSSNNYNSYNSLKQSITIKNGNFVAWNESYSGSAKYNAGGITQRANINLYIENCTIQASGYAIVTYYGKTTISYCEITCKDKTQRTIGILSQYVGDVISTQNLFDTCNVGIKSADGGLVQTAVDQFTNCATNIQ